MSSKGLKVDDEVWINTWEVLKGVVMKVTPKGAKVDLGREGIHQISADIIHGNKIDALVAYVRLDRRVTGEKADRLANLDPERAGRVFKEILGEAIEKAELAIKRAQGDIERMGETYALADRLAGMQPDFLEIEGSDWPERWVRAAGSMEGDHDAGLVGGR